MIWRARGRRTFAGLARGRRCRAGLVTVTWADDGAPIPPRVAYAIGKRVGPAVRRNRVRRRLRAIVGQHASQLRPGVYLVGVAPGAADLSFTELSHMFTRALSQLQAPGVASTKIDNSKQLLTAGPGAAR